MCCWASEWLEVKESIAILGEGKEEVYNRGMESEKERERGE